MLENPFVYWVAFLLVPMVLGALFGGGVIYVLSRISKKGKPDV